MEGHTMFMVLKIQYCKDVSSPQTALQIPCSLNENHSGSFICYFIFLTSLLEYSSFTVVCQFLLYNKVNQLYIYMYPHISSLLLFMENGSGVKLFHKEQIFHANETLVLFLEYSIILFLNNDGRFNMPVFLPHFIEN